MKWFPEFDAGLLTTWGDEEHRGITPQPGKFDGKDYPLTGDSSADSRSYKTINDHTLDLANKIGGKVVATGRVVVSPDGKSRTIHLSTTDSAGKKIASLGVYDK